MFAKGRGIRVLLTLGVALAAAAGAWAGGERTPDERQALEQKALKLNQEGIALYRQGKFAEAAAALEKGLALYRRLHPKGDPLLAVNLHNLGTTLRMGGDLEGAEKHYREALSLRRRLFPKDHPAVASSLNGLGDVLRERGDLAGAEQYARDALAMYRRLFPGDDPALAVSLGNLGGVLRERGDLEGAEKYARDALAMFRRLHPDDHPDVATGLSKLGSVLQDRGDLAGAEKHYRDALAMRERISPAGHPALASIHNSLGVTLQTRGDLAGAEKHYRAALAVYRRRSLKDDPALAACLNNVGEVLQDRGDLAGAEKFCREALAMTRRLHPADHPDLVRGLNNVGAVLRARGDRAGAEPHYRDALAVQQRLLLKEALLLAEADALNLAAAYPPTRDGYLAATRGRADDPTAYDLLWQGRGALTRLAERRHRDLLASRDPATRALGDRLLSARQRLARLLLAPAAASAEHAAEVRQRTAAKEDLEKELATRLRLPAAVPLPPPSRLADRLPAGAVFLDCYRYTDFEADPQVPGRKGERATPRYAAFVLSRGRPAVRVELGEAAAVERAWAAWHRAITQDRPAAQERQAAAALARLIWEPIRGKLPAGVQTVYLAPDGALTQVPFAALPGAKPGTVLLEECAFATVPHGPYLLERLTEKEQARPGGGTLLAVGGVDYAPPPGGPAAGKRGAWAPLPATRAETERVAALAEQYARLKARRFRGDEATTAGVLEALPQARYAHLATHGFFADAQFRSAFQVDPEAFNHRTPDRRGGARSPLVLSGLVFAGANRQGEEANPDRGLLTAEALVGLRLDGLELAVLSACNTGLGEVGGGEGVYGLQRAFHLAGCKNVIASLWAVEDESTAALMTLFYTNLWREKLSPLEALRQAQLYLYRHPQQVQQLARRDFEEVPLPREGANPPGPRARTAQWAAFTFSGVAAPPKRP